MNHPNIVTIYAVEEAGGVPFLTLELVEGRTLDALIASGGLPLARILAYAIPLADAVGAAHQRGVTHRDLKHGNMMIGDDGRVKVLDFGISDTEPKTRQLHTPSAVPGGFPSIFSVRRPQRKPLGVAPTRSGIDMKRY